MTLWTLHATAGVLTRRHEETCRGAPVTSRGRRRDAARGRRRQEDLPALQREHSPGNTLILNPGLQNCSRTPLCGLKRPGLWPPVQQPQEAHRAGRSQWAWRRMWLCLAPRHQWTVRTAPPPGRAGSNLTSISSPWASPALLSTACALSLTLRGLGGASLADEWPVMVQECPQALSGQRGRPTVVIPARHAPGLGPRRGRTRAHA